MQTRARILGRTLLLSLPMVVMLLSYVLLDPFKTLYHYQSYDGGFVYVNRDFHSTEVFLNNCRASTRYDSFILGNSRTMGFLTSDWKPYLPSPNQPFHFDASLDTLFGIHHKIQLIKRLKLPLRNCLILFDNDSIKGTVNSKGHLFIKHPVVSGESWAPFQMTFLKAYFSDKFFLGFWDYSLFGVKRDYMAAMLVPKKQIFDPLSNDIYNVELEEDTLKYGELFYSNFPPRAKFVEPGAQYDKGITTPEQLEMLRDIRQVFQSDSTDYKIIIPPNYNRIRLHPEDMQTLASIFGADHIFDFSTVSRYNADVHNFYDPYHFRTRIGKEILAEIYGGSTKAENPPR